MSDAKQAVKELVEDVLKEGEGNWPPKTCSCGSGLDRSANYDARGIFLTYTCDKCHREKMSHYRSDVLTDPDYWHSEPIDDE